MKGMIFAAGIGSRLKPFTDHHPKAMVEVGGTPMLERVIRNFKSVGITEIVVNVHHFANQIIDFLQTNNNFGADIKISDESALLLDTGGGVAKAASLLGHDDAVLLHNADILTDFDLAAMIDSHIKSDADATLAVSLRKSSRQLYFDSDDRLAGWQNLSTKETRPGGFIPEASVMKERAFSGIHILSPKALTRLTEYADGKGPFSIIPFYLDACAELTIKGYEQPGSLRWFDIGRPETLLQARSEWSDPT